MMAPVLHARHLKALKAFFMLGLLLLMLGVNGAADKATRRSNKQERSSQNHDQNRMGVLDRAPRKSVRTVKLILDPEFMHSPERTYDAWKNSISPWRYSQIHYDDQFPPVISQAECLLTGCRDSKGQEDMSLISKPIYNQILILRRVKDEQKSNLVFRLENKMVRVGCTCVRPNVVSQE